MAEVMAGKYGLHMLGKRYDLLTHAEYWTELARAQKRPTLQAEQAAALQRVARKAALATGLLSAEDIENRRAGVTLYPQHVDEDVARASIRGMIVVCLESPEAKSPTVGYFRGWLRQNPVARAIVNAIAAEKSDVGEMARKFLAPALIKEGRAVEAAAGAEAESQRAAEWWRTQNPGKTGNDAAAANAELGLGAEAYVDPELPPAEGEHQTLPGVAAVQEVNAGGNVGTLTAPAKRLLLFHAGGAHAKDLEVTDGKAFVIVAKETDKSAPEVLEEFDTERPDWKAKTAEAAELKVARLYLYERAGNGKEMECVESWPAGKR